MATTVTAAFNEFMRDTVNLDPAVTKNARLSRDNLLANIAEFDNIDGFFDLWSSMNIHFGSFARKTKCRELDDIDLMICIAANGATYNSFDPWYNVTIHSSTTNQAQINCSRENGTLNSTQVLNSFKKKLEAVRDYNRSDIKRNGEAIVLDLVSRYWSFDIIPCFHTTAENDGRSYYLIPNADGNWKKTNPILDQERVTNINQKHNGNVLELIRLYRKWNMVKNAATLPSYLVETVIVNYCETTTLTNYIDLTFRDALPYVANKILYPVNDMKNIQGDINTLSTSDRSIISFKASIDYAKAKTASECEFTDPRKSINLWGEVFGGDFPAYG